MFENRCGNSETCLEEGVEMKRVLFCSLALLAVASVASAADSRAVRATLAPVLASQSGGIPMPMPLSPTPDPAYSAPGGAYIPNGDPVVISPGTPIMGQPLELFPDVRYRATRNISPCAVPTIIQVADPCNKDRCCRTCVNIQVCVPPCDPCNVKVTRDGGKVRYDYGKYAVVARTVGNHVVVHYED